MLWGLWILLHSHNVFFFFLLGNYLQTLLLDGSPISVLFFTFFGVICFIFFFAEVFSTHVWFRDRISRDRHGVSVQDLGLPLPGSLLSTPTPAFQLMWLIWILSSDSSGQRNCCLPISAVPTVACSQHQSHKKLVTSPMQFPSSKRWLPSKVYLLSSLYSAWRLRVRTRVCFIYGRVSSADLGWLYCKRKPRNQGTER